MTEEQILKKAIEKAVKNGWETWWTPYLKENKEKRLKAVLKYTNTLEGIAVQITGYGDESWDGYSKGGLLDWSNGFVISVLKPESIIFSHSFAKAFWGETSAVCAACKFDNIPDCFCLDKKLILKWQYHLQQMVLEKEPIKYLEKFI